MAATSRIRRLFAAFSKEGNDLKGDVKKELRKWVVGVIAVGILTTGAALIAPIREAVFEPIRVSVGHMMPWNRPMSQEKAMEIAKRLIGSSAQVAIPFKNLGEDSDYILVWKSIACDWDAGCNGIDVRGAVIADLIVGRSDVFEVRNTLVQGLDGTYPPEMIQYLEQQVRNASLIDFDNDGVKDIFARSWLGHTGPIHDVNYTLYNTMTGTSASVSLRVSSTGSSNITFENANRKLSSWFRDRDSEYIKYWHWEECSRNFSGVFRCKTPPDEEYAKDLELSGALGNLDYDWVSSNGVDFTIGRVKLNYIKLPPNSYEDTERCKLHSNDGQIFSNQFKGSILIFNESTGETAALYVQDPEHSREIPSMVLSKRFLWLGSYTEHGIIAYELSTEEILNIAFTDDYISYDESTYQRDFRQLPVGMAFDEAWTVDEKDYKDWQAFIFVENDWLKVGEKDAVFLESASIAKDEFVGATQCIDY